MVLKQTLLTITGVFSFAMFSSSAAVIKSNEHFFHLKITDTVNATPSEAYQQFLRVDEWWNSEHTWFGDATKLSIEPKANGCFCEISGERQAMHMQVTYVEPNKSVHMTGGLGPLQMLGLHGGMRWSFNALEEGKTEIVQEYRVIGYLESGLTKLAPIVDSVQSIQMQGLVDKLNKK